MMKEMKRQKQLIGLKSQQHPSLILDVNLDEEEFVMPKAESKPQIKHTSALINEETTTVHTPRRGRTFLFDTQENKNVMPKMGKRGIIVQEIDGDDD